MKIRWKLTLILLVPLALLGFFVWSGVSDRRDEAAEAKRAEDLISFYVLSGGAQATAQDEQGLTGLIVGAEGAVPQALLDARRETVDSLAAVRDSLFAVQRIGQRARDSREQTTTAVERAREAIDAYDAAAADANARNSTIGFPVFEELNASLVGLDYALISSIQGDVELARRLFSYVALLEAASHRAATHALVAASGDGSAVGLDRILTVEQQAKEEEASLALFRSTATDPADVALFDSTVTGPAVLAAESSVTALLNTRSGTVPQLNRAAFHEAMQEKSRLASSVADALATTLRTIAADKHSSASANATTFTAAGAGAAAIAILLAGAVAFGITRRLGRLSAAARELATVKLPALVDGLRSGRVAETLATAPVELEGLGKDEIGEVGAALRTVQGATLDVARAQAELVEKGISDIFVKLARRNQSLVERQIALLDELEESERDPDVLDNLFKLDHIATRIRRNAENLLVLSGAEPTRRWKEPVPLTRMLQASMGEVEDFRRIHLADVEDIAVSGTASLDLTHLFAELLENAVRFSPPDAPVEVSARRKGDGVIVVVADRGMGMTDEQLSEANVLLASPPHAGLSMSRTLGHYVVARLAARYGVVVRVDRSIDGGIVATATLPPALLVADMEAGGFELGAEPVAEDVAAELAPPVDAPAPSPVRPLLAPPRPAPVEPVVPEPQPQPAPVVEAIPAEPAIELPSPPALAEGLPRREAPPLPTRPAAPAPLAPATAASLAPLAPAPAAEPQELPQRAAFPPPLLDPAPLAAQPPGGDGDNRPLPRRGRTPVLGVPHQSAVGVAAPNRSPEASRQLLAGFKSGFERGRHAAHEHESDLEGTDG